MSERQGCGTQILIGSITTSIVLFWLWLFLSSASELIVALSRGTPFSQSNATEAFRKEGHSYSSTCNKVMKKYQASGIKGNWENCLDWKVLWGSRSKVEDQRQINKYRNLPSFDSKALDTIPNRLQRLRNYQNETILTKNAINREMGNVATGGDFSPQLRRAAMDALAPSPIEFLKVQAERYGIGISPEVIKHVNDRSYAVTTP